MSASTSTTKLQYDNTAVNGEDDNTHTVSSSQDYRCKGHRTGLILISLFFFAFGTWVYSCLYFVRAAELMTPDSSISRFQRMLTKNEYDFHWTETLEPVFFLSLVATVSGFVLCVVTLIQEVGLRKMTDIRISFSRKLGITICLLLALRLYVTTQESSGAAEDYFFNEHGKEILYTGVLLTLLSFAMLADLSVMPVVWLIRLYVAQEMMTFGFYYQMTSNVEWMREVLLRYPSPTPLAFYVYQIPLLILKIWNFYIIQFTLFPGFFFFCLPEICHLNMIRNFVVRMQIIQCIINILTRNGPAPYLCHMILLMACSIRDTPRPRSHFTFSGFSYKVLLCVGCVWYVYRVLGDIIHHNLFHLLPDIITTIKSQDWNTLFAVDSDLRQLLMGIKLLMKPNGHRMKHTMAGGIAIMNLLTFLGILSHFISKARYTPIHGRAKSWIVWFGKVLVSCALFFFLIVVQKRQLGISRAQLSGLDAEDTTLEFFLRLLIPPEFIKFDYINSIVSFYSLLFLTPTIMTFPDPFLANEMNSFRSFQMSTAEQQTTFDYIRHSESDAWIVLPMKYAIPYDMNKPMRASWLYYPFLEMTHKQMFINGDAGSKIQGKTQIEHLLQGTPEILKHFTGIPDDLYDRRNFQDVFLREYQCWKWTYDYGKGFVTLHSKKNSMSTGKVWRKQREDNYIQKRNLAMNFEHERNILVAGYGFWTQSAAHSSASHGRRADYEPVNLLMRQFKSRTIIDFALYSGSFVGIVFAVYSFERKSTAAAFKEKLD